MINETGWDYLLILDACRYDYFEKLYEHYLDGKLRKVVSPGSNTSEWAKKNFRGEYPDIVYVSANPGINSKVPVKGFDAKKHFPYLIDVWDWGWDEKIQTVHPREVDKAALEARDDYPDKRFIVHYIQPHPPYLGLGLGGKRGGAPSRIEKWLGKLVGRRVRRFVGKTIERVFEDVRILYMTRNVLGLPPLTTKEVALRTDNNTLRQLYEENLRIALAQVARLAEKLDGKIVVTSDHGERLGEGAKYAHEPGSNDPRLVEVPWFVIESVKKRD